VSPSSDKRSFTPSSFPGELGAVVRVLPRLARAYVKPRISRALREKVMLATTAVNDCRYCAWVHSRVASAHGVDLEEIAALLAGTELEVQDDREALAVLYAQRFAQTRGKPEPELTERLFDEFGPRAANELLAYIKGITFANLSGNTLDAVLERIGARRS
jgi:AhpD family alkylhydroperoxidase